MIGIAFHSPALISLMIDREKFSVVMVPYAFDNATQKELEEFFGAKLRAGVRSLLLVEKVETLSKIASRFPDVSARVVLFDVIDKLEPFTDMVVDVQKNNNARLSSVTPNSLNLGLGKLKAIAFKEYRKDFESKVSIAIRAGDLVSVLNGASEPMQVASVKYLLGQTAFATVKRAGRQEKARVLQLRQYSESELGLNLVHAYMDVALYGTDEKIAALFSSADLDDLRFATSTLSPEADMAFGGYEVPDKLRLARE